MTASAARVATARKITQVALAAVAARDRIRYTQKVEEGRGSIARKCEPGRAQLPAGPLADDCSSSVTGYYRAAGAPDPSGLDYKWIGWTGTLCKHGVKVPIDQAQPGDLAFYGDREPWHHVAVVVGRKDGRIMVVSHGSDPGPFLLPIDYRHDLGQVRRYPLAPA